MAIFVATEATLFGTMIGTYFYLRFRTVHWPPAGVPEPKVVVPLVLTGVLVSTSVLMQLAFAGARRARLGLVRVSLLAALIVQSGYLAMQLHLYLDDLHSFSPNASAYASIYFTMVGAHHFHVLIGILLNAWLLLRFVGGGRGRLAVPVGARDRHRTQPRHARSIGRRSQYRHAVDPRRLRA